MKKVIYIAIFVASTVALLSFTVASKSSSKGAEMTNHSEAEASGGFAVEDNNQWN